MDKVYVAVLTAIIVGFGMKAYDYFNPKPPVMIYTTAKPSEAVKDAPKELINTSGLKVHPKRVNKDLGVSEDKRVISAVICPSDTHDQTVIDTVDPLTGETETSFKKEPYKWLQAGGTKELSIGYGFSNRGAVWTVTGRMDIAQIKAWHVGIIGAVNSRQDAVAGVEARWLFD